MTEGSTVISPTFTFAIAADSTILALSWTFFDFFVDDCNISAGVNLTQLSCPFPLQSAGITSIIRWKPYIFPFNDSFLSATRKRTFVIGWVIKRDENCESIFIGTISNSYCAITSWWRVEHLPSNIISWTWCSYEMHVSFFTSSAWRGR